MHLEVNQKITFLPLDRFCLKYQVIIPPTKDLAVELSLNSEALSYKKVYPELFSENNPLLHLEGFDRFLNWVHQRYRVKFSVEPPFMERSDLWAGSYLQGRFIHAGADITLNPQTPIASNLAGKIIYLYNDYPSNHGWGELVVVRPKINPKVVLMFAHIKTNNLQVGQEIESGEQIGTIASSNENGFWWPHLHIQAMTYRSFQNYLNNIDELDGYYPLEREKLFKKILLDPSKIG